MDWTAQPQTDKDIAPVYTCGDWALRCTIISDDRSLWTLERRDRTPISQGIGFTALFLAQISITDYEHGITQLFDMSAAYINDYELSKH